ncbi:hypothetical protein BLNAU_542 [Blattamonas nauphoetae]|uniref:SAC3/GANP/THP3 conserved domain-containing protein n=1 Tax=Blattamonas nauphoetae TaxID=2049346 RepID=A0ABQ9YLV3_9EUKA|nr:hypothetical protein BLNAU_542 [Blattamonas nauphoetae]
MNQSFIIGTCDGMCPTEQITERIANKDFHFLECVTGTTSPHRIPIPEKFIKKYERSAASKRFLPETVRTETGLALSITILFRHFSEWYPNEAEIYPFLHDRIRAIHSDVLLQRLYSPQTSNILEQSIIILLLSQQSASIRKDFDWKSHNALLQQLFLTDYDIVSHLICTEPSSVTRTNRLFISYTLLFFSQNTESSVFFLRSVSPCVLRTQELQLGILFLDSLLTQNYYRIVSLIQLSRDPLLHILLSDRLNNLYRSTCSLLKPPHSQSSLLQQKHSPEIESLPSPHCMTSPSVEEVYDYYSLRTNE